MDKYKKLFVLENEYVLFRNKDYDGILENISGKRIYLPKDCLLRLLSTLLEQSYYQNMETLCKVAYMPFKDCIDWRGFFKNYEFGDKGLYIMDCEHIYYFQSPSKDKILGAEHLKDTGGKDDSK